MNIDNAPNTVDSSNYLAKKIIKTAKYSYFSIVFGAIMNFSDKLRSAQKREVLTQEDIWITFQNHSREAVHSGISRSLKSGDILKLKRGLYLFGERLQKNSVSLFVIANKMYSPSYISFETALSHHGLIPEAVFVTTSACHQRKKKQFHTTYGDYTYDFIPCFPFFMGIEHSKEKGGVLIANPLKALFDLVYCRRKRYSDLEDLETDWRVDLEALGKHVNQYSLKELEILAKSYKKRNITTLFEILIREYK